jgi:hypothetical protein
MHLLSEAKMAPFLPVLLATVVNMPPKVSSEEIWACAKAKDSRQGLNKHVAKD